MSNIKKKFCAVLVVLFAILMILGICLSLPPEVSAATTYFPDEKYTEDDHLLQPNGELSSRMIGDFAVDVKKSLEGQSFPELAQVVPLEYLETTEENAEFSYNGKEYGFYMAKEGNYFDILLIDFIYEFEDENHTNNEYKIRIEPILQQRFNRTGTAGDYQWEKTTNHYKYYVYNPRFLTTVQNENDLNYGDTGYSKLTDDGVIIQQTRLNYSKILYKNEEDLWETCFEFGADKILSTVTDKAFDFLNTYTYGLMGFVKDLYNFTETLYEEGQEVKVEANNEANIFTEQSKNEQRNGPLDGYSRVATFCPADEIVLAAAEDTAENINDNSYAEFITVLNDTNYRTRLNQYCEFDIVRRTWSYGSMEEVNDPDIESYSFTKERILFGESSEKELEFDESATAYNLPHGTDSFIFTPAVSGTYTFSADNSNARLSLYPQANKNDVKFSGESVGSAYLQGGTIYSLDASMAGENSGRYSVNASVGVWNSETIKENQPIPAGGQLYKLVAGERGGYQISSSNSNIRYRLYNSNMQYMYESESNLFSQYLASGQAYYLYVYSINHTAQTATLSFSAVEEIEAGEEYEISVDYPIMYKFTAPDSLEKETYYSVIFKDMADDFNGEIFGNSNSINYASSDGLQSMSLYLEPGEEIYIQMSSLSPFTLKVDQAASLFTWTVEGVEQDTNTICLQRGRKWDIGLKIDGVEVDNAIYSSNVALTNGMLDLTNYSDITNPADNSSYLYFYAIQDNTPLPLLVCVTHNFDFAFDVYNGETYGFNWETISPTSSEYFVINYKVTAGNKSKRAETADYVRVGSSQSILDIVEKDMNYSGVEDVTIEILSVEFYLEDNAGDKVKIATIYNEKAEDYNTVEDKREKYQNFSCDAMKVNALFGGGAGTETDPYQIYSMRHLKNIQKNIKSGMEMNSVSLLASGTTQVVGNYIMTADISLSGNWTPLGSGLGASSGFAGSFNGNGHTIKNLTMSVSTSDSRWGLFREIAGSIRNLTLENVNITGTGSSGNYMTWVGAFAGYARSANIYNCHITSGTINIKGSNTVVGGFVGQGQVTIRDCTNNLNITGLASIGGYVGVTNSGTIADSEIKGTITGGNKVGGFVGSAEKTTFENLKFRAEVVYKTRVTNNDCVGGVVGVSYNSTVLSVSGLSGKVVVKYKSWNDRYLQPYIGGLIGYIQKGAFDLDNFSGYAKFPEVDGYLNSSVKWGTTYYNQAQYVGRYVGNPFLGGED